jgi:hypothetical protein
MAKAPVGAALRGRLNTSPSAFTTTAGSVQGYWAWALSASALLGTEGHAQRANHGLWMNTQLWITCDNDDDCAIFTKLLDSIIDADDNDTPNQ